MSELLLEGYECKTYKVDDKVICVTRGKSKYNDDAYEAVCGEG